YVTSINQTNSESKVYAMDFSLVKSSIGLSSVKFITVWIDPTYTKLLNITTSGISWWGGPGGPNVGPDLTSVCDKSPPCYLRYYSVPTEATSLCSAEMGCYEVGPNGHSIHLGSSSVPEFPFALPILVISLASIFIFYRIKFKF
ncbi:MAG: hypothetical protein WBF38_01605, partial [Nitrosotalea sp.]